MLFISVTILCLKDINNKCNICDNSPNGFIVAIDESETSLHIGSQKKLFGLLKELSKIHQVIITIHSVVFIDKTHEFIIVMLRFWKSERKRRKYTQQRKQSFL